MKKYFFVVILLIISASIRCQSIKELNTDWKCKKAKELNGIYGEQISSSDFQTKGWLKATVPGTVLSTLIDDKLLPDPFFGMNNKLIPDIFDIGKDYYTYWFVKDFKQSLSTPVNQVWLKFRGINYGCLIYLNGHCLTSDIHKGMFLRQTFNITPYLSKDGRNRVAVIVFPPDDVGNPNGGQGGDGRIAKNVMHQYVAGWDWIQAVPDRNTGIWDKVFIQQTGPVRILNPHIITKVKGVRDPMNTHQEPAEIQVETDLTNASNTSQNGIVSYSLDGHQIEKQVIISPGETKHIQLPVYSLIHPKLWWPNTYGPQNLYSIRLEFRSKEGVLFDIDTLHIGVREIQTCWNPHTKSRELKVNGQPIFIKGGNWIISDELLRFSNARYDAEIRFHKDMNLNLIRVWGGAITERPEFYQACDKYGLLVMQDFWGSGDCNGRWKDPLKKDNELLRREYPDDHELFIKSASDQIKMIRNHPSLAFWCGGNEIKQPIDLQHALEDSLLPLLDGTRWFVPYSNDSSMSLNTIGGNGDGPYGIQDIRVFWGKRTFPFNSEVGSVGMGDIQSLQRFIPKQNLKIPETYKFKSGGHTLDSIWAYHKYLGYGTALQPYGACTDLEKYCKTAQLVNYDQYRGLIEGFTAHQWEWYTGVIIWKTQNPWTALRGQMYDYYLDPNGGLYGLKKAGESIHIMFNPVDSALYGVNNYYKKQSDLTLVAKFYDIYGHQQLIAQKKCDLAPNATQRLLAVSDQISKLTQKLGGFLYLQLNNKEGKMISENIYWLKDSSGLYSGLVQMPESKLKVNSKVIHKGQIEIELYNPKNATVAFFNRISIVDEEKQRLLPIHYSDNYVTILPAETRTIQIDFSPSLLKQKPVISIEGWNFPIHYYSITEP